MSRQVQVQNAASHEQVERAGRKHRDRQRRRFDVYVAVLNTPEGRELIWDLLSRTKMFETPFHASGSSVYYNIGRSDFGRELLGYLTTEHQEAYLLMEAEARRADQREQREIAAANTPQRNKESEE